VVWFFGSFWRLATVANSFRSTWRLIHSTRNMRPLPDYQRLCNFDVVVSPELSTPIAISLRQPKIILPERFVREFTPERLKPIVLHELAHIQRRDLWAGAFQEVLAIVFWWSPVMRVLNRRIHITRELACDIRAVHMLADNKQYAQSLLDCARIMVAERKSVLAMGLFSRKKDLTYRIGQVMKTKAVTMPKLVTTVLVCGALATVTTVAAQTLAPKINVRSISQESNHYSNLTRAESEAVIALIRRNDYERLSQYVADGLDINVPLLGDGTALIVAAREGNRPMVEHLLALGADIDQTALGEGSPLINAIAGNHPDLARDLIAWGASVDTTSVTDGNALIAAARVGNTETAGLLYRSGADVNAITPNDETPLITAARHDHLPMVSLLVESGADVNLGVEAATGSGRVEYRTPLNSARSAAIRDYLLAAGATQ
jgi:hypothetical protein